MCTIIIIFIALSSELQQRGVSGVIYDTNTGRRGIVGATKNLPESIKYMLVALIVGEYIVKCVTLSI